MSYKQTYEIAEPVTNSSNAQLHDLIFGMLYNADTQFVHTNEAIVALLPDSIILSNKATRLELTRFGDLKFTFAHDREASQVDLSHPNLTDLIADGIAAIRTYRKQAQRRQRRDWKHDQYDRELTEH